MCFAAEESVTTPTEPKPIPSPTEQISTSEILPNPDPVKPKETPTTNIANTEVNGVKTDSNEASSENNKDANKTTTDSKPVEELYDIPAGKLCAIGYLYRMFIPYYHYEVLSKNLVG